jgi:hypothetical protein
MVFITRGPELRGRVSSHPKREAGPSKRKKARVEVEEGERLELVPTEPLLPAWDDLMSLSNQGVVYDIQIAALHTHLQNVLRGQDEEGIRFAISFPKYSPPDLQPSDGEEEFRLEAQCMVTLSTTQKEDDSVDSYCVFMYEVRVAYHQRAWLLC